MLTKFVLNKKGVRQLLKSAPVKADLEARAKRIANAAGPGFEADSFTGRNRVRADVYPETFEARRAEIERHALTRAIGAGRG